MSINWKPNWKKGDLIRNIMTGKPLLVVHIYSLGENASATMTVDLEDSKDPTPMMLLQQRDYDHWVKDSDMQNKNNGENIEWEYNPFV